MEDDEAWLYGDDQAAEPEANIDEKKEVGVSIMTSIFCYLGR